MAAPTQRTGFSAIGYSLIIMCRPPSCPPDVAGSNRAAPHPHREKRESAGLPLEPYLTPFQRESGNAGLTLQSPSLPDSL